MKLITPTTSPKKIAAISSPASENRHCNRNRSKIRDTWCLKVTRPKKKRYREMPSHDPCRNVLSVVSQTIAATPPLLPVKMAYCNPKTGLGGGYCRKSLPLKPTVLPETPTSLNKGLDPLFACFSQQFRDKRGNSPHKPPKHCIRLAKQHTA